MKKFFGNFDIFIYRLYLIISIKISTFFDLFQPIEIGFFML